MHLKEKIIKNENLRKATAYGISGVITTILSFVLFKVFLEVIDYIFAFSLSWILAVTFAYLSTRRSVYNSKADKIKEKFIEYVKFILGRIVTYVVNLVLLMMAVEIFELDEFYSNIVITIVVVILNYFMGEITINRLKKRGK